MLETFIRFGSQRYPACATALVLLNHGSGFYVPLEMLSREGEKSGHDGSSHSIPRRRRRIFHATRERLREAGPASRGIAYDDSAGRLSGQPVAETRVRRRASAPRAQG